MQNNKGQEQNAPDDSIQVILRIRQMNKKEKNQGAQKCIISSETNPQMVDLLQKPNPQKFMFDGVCPPEFGQQEVFSLFGINLVDSCLSGYNACILAYGQTGAGKTYTMQGNEFQENNINNELSEQRGLMPRCFEYLFQQLNQQQFNEHLVQCSYFEIYNEEIYDLLSDRPVQTKCNIRESINGFFIEGISQNITENSHQALQILQKGQKQRHTGHTLMNSESSRSHSVLTMLVETKQIAQELTYTKQSKLHFVDLAGSERQSKTQATGDRLKEAKNINKSLTTLGLVINTLIEKSQGKNRHIPYRDSKLTHILKDSLGGNSKTYMIAAVSEASNQFEDTLSTLKFAQRAKMIKQKASINQESSASLESLKKEIQRLKSELNYIDSIKKQENQESDHLHMVKSFIKDWNFKLGEINNFVVNQLKDFEQIYYKNQNELESQQKQQEDITNIQNSLNSSKIDEKLEISHLKLYQLQILKSEIEDKLLKQSNIQFQTESQILQNNFTQNQNQNQTQQINQEVINKNNVNQEKIIEQNNKKDGILTKILKGIKKISTDKSEFSNQIFSNNKNFGYNLIKQTDINQQKSDLQTNNSNLINNELKQQTIKEMEIETDIKEQYKTQIQENCKLQEQQQKQIQEQQQKIFQLQAESKLFQNRNQEIEKQNQNLLLQIQLLKDKQLENDKIENNYQQQIKQLKQDIDTHEEMRIHWENMYYDEYKKYRFNYKLVCEHAEEIEKLRKQNEQLKQQQNSIQNLPLQVNQNTSNCSDISALIKKEEISQISKFNQNNIKLQKSQNQDDNNNIADNLENQSSISDNYEEDIEINLDNQENTTPKKNTISQNKLNKKRQSKIRISQRIQQKKIKYNNNTSIINTNNNNNQF